MSSRFQKSGGELDARGVRKLPEHEIIAILRAADDTQGGGGRNMLVKILKGSKDKQLLSRGLNENPLYGYYEELSEEEILKRVDWMIIHGYFQFEVEGRRTVLTYTEKGWEIEKESYARELRLDFDELLESGKQPYDLSYLETTNREVLEILLDQLQESGDPKYISLLETWQPFAPRWLRARINQAIAHLKPSA